jgi:hypothetical protein
MEPEGSLPVYKSPSLACILRQMNSFHTLPPYFLKIHLTLFSDLCLGILSGVFPSGFPTKILYAFLI